MAKHSKFLIFVLAVLTIGILILALNRGNNPVKISSIPPEVKAETAKESVIGSPDGKWNLGMKEERGQEDITYVFKLTKLADNSVKEIFRKTVSLSTSMEIPANTFSPDDKYIFLKEHNSGQTDYVVMTSGGTPLAKDIVTAEISSLFASKYPNLKITDVTGWAGTNLLLVNSDKIEGGTGPSLWFILPSRTFSQLSTRFN
jgi:hypothetical protein